MVILSIINEKFDIMNYIGINLIRSSNDVKTEKPKKKNTKSCFTTHLYIREIFQGDRHATYSYEY